MTIRKLWFLLGTVLFVAFFILGFFGREVYRQAPPIPKIVVTTNGQALMDENSILDGQQVWQSIGGQQIGTIWGHGAYQAPDWSADWLHREATTMLNLLGIERHGTEFDELTEDKRAGLRALVQSEMRKNTYDSKTGTVTISSLRAKAIAQTAEHYIGLFGADEKYDGLRNAYALHKEAVPDPKKRQLLTHFFFWTAWACATERPGKNVTYTNNWPHEPLIGNHPTSSNLLWSILSIVFLIAGVGGLVWYKAFKTNQENSVQAPIRDPFDGLQLTPSMKAVWKFAAVVIGLFALQVGLGALTAHYTVEGNAVFGLPVADYVPYVISRTWHVQLGVFWIATAFLGAGLFLGPAAGGKEPRFQRAGVNLLFVALVIVVLGSLAGEWFSVKQKMSLNTSFWFGHQGYEYVDLGRFWQISLFVGLVLWLVLMVRSLWPALKAQGDSRSLVWLFAGSSGAIGLFYAAGFFYGARTHLTVMEYWRWWVVHLWVEGFMEVFATAAMAFIFSKMGLVKPANATRATLLSTSIFLIGGIPGTFHHLYFTGTPTSIMAIGSTFSALEVVPLALIGFEAWETYRVSKQASWMIAYRWPIRFFLGVAFWNLVGAGLFGFMINPPIALYYMQGLNTTPLHGHTALFGVYGLLALGLTLLVLRRLQPQGVWDERPVAFSFWAMNIGLALMVALSLLPIGLMQAAASIDQGLWYARSAEYLQQPLMQNLRWLRIIGDSIFIMGTASLVWFVVGLRMGWSFEKNKGVDPNLSPVADMGNF
ncbi:MAG: nitric-oxide reductase large subunit [Deltaproteobacteria bacterium]|nr:nitric-oxide reductase large subunit [Deltaproteobacteria bacterium]